MYSKRTDVEDNCEIRVCEVPPANHTQSDTHTHTKVARSTKHDWNAFAVSVFSVSSELTSKASTVNNSIST